MDSDYVKQLDAWIKEKGIKKQDANVAAFLAVREHVKARLEDGYSATVIFAYLRDTKQIDVCYDTFLKYVHRHVRPPRGGLKKGSADRTKRLGEVAVLASGRVSVSTPRPLEGFVFNPVANADELL